MCGWKSLVIRHELSYMWVAQLIYGTIYLQTEQPYFYNFPILNGLPLPLNLVIQTARSWSFDILLVPAVAILIYWPTDQLASIDQSYLNQIENIHECISLPKFRLSNHSLMIEKGRYQKIEKAFRFCPFCPQQVEDEMHFLLDWTSHLMRDFHFN